MIKIFQCIYGKTMIYDQDLPMHLWEEVTRTVVYVQNRISDSALGFKTPKEMFTGKKPEVSHLKIFGCPVYVHIPKEKRTKLDPSGRREYLLDTVKYPRHSEFTFLDSITWKSVKMLHSMKRKPSRDPGSANMKKCMRKRHLP